MLKFKFNILSYVLLTNLCLLGCSNSSNSINSNISNPNNQNIKNNTVINSSAIYDNLDLQNISRELNVAVNYNNQEVFVVGHKNPDSDTVCSAIAYANLYNHLGIKATPMVSGKINNETNFILNYFGVSTPSILDNASNKNIVLVDHSVYAQSVKGIEQANIVGVIDHHAIGDVISSSPIYLRCLPIGSTASAITIEYLEKGVVIEKQIAGLLLGALLSDTNNLTSSTTTDIDKKLAQMLAKLSKVEDINTFYSKLLDASISYGDMTAEEIFNSDYKEFKMGASKVGITQVNMNNATKDEITKKMTDVLPLLYKTKNMDYLFVLATDKENNRTEILYYGKNAQDIAIKAFGSQDGKHVILEKAASRKKDIVPPLMNILK